MIGLERPDHAFARGNGARRKGNGARRFHRPLVDRRRHDQPHAHGRENRAGVPPAGDPRARRFARRRRDGQSAQRGYEGQFHRGKQQGTGTRAGKAFRRGRRSLCCRSRKRGSKKPVYDWSAYDAAAAVVPRHARLQSRASRGNRSVHRLDAVLPRLGAARNLSEDFRAGRRRPESERAVRRRPEAARLHRARKIARSARRDRIFPRQQRSGRYRSVRGRIAPPAHDVPHVAAAAGEGQSGAQLRRGGFRRAARKRQAGLSGRVRGHRGAAHRAAGRKI